MKTTTSQKFKTGLFSVIGFGILILFIFLIGSQKNMFTSTFNVKGNFKNVSGLMPGNLVRFAGINVGTVNSINLINDTTVSVDIILQKNVKPFIKSDSKISIASDGLIGDKLVTISAGSDSLGVPIKDNQLLAVVNPLEMDKLLVRVTGIATKAEAIVNNIAGITSKVNNGEGSLGRLINDNKLALGLESTLASTKKTSESIGRAANGLGDNLEAAKKSILFRGYFKKKEKKRIKDSTEKANKILDKKLKPVNKKKG